MVRKEMRLREIHYCDVCGSECGLPYYGRDEQGYGDCCSPKMHRAERYYNAVNAIRTKFEMPQLEITFELLKEEALKWQGPRFNMKRVA